MSFPEILGLVSGVFLISGYIPYIYEVIKGTTTPNRASWFIWALSTVIILFGVHEEGTNEAIWVPVADAIGCVSIFLLSISMGVGGWSKTDKLSLAICFLSLVILFTTGNVLITLIVNLLIYISGYIPTIKKEIQSPGTESFFAWSLFFIGVVLNFVTVLIGNDSGFGVWIYPVVLLVAVGTLYLLILRSVFMKKN